jgi:coenzyme PQQ precursor peptide PqqA
LLRGEGCAAVAGARRYPYDCRKNEEGTMAWTTPTLVEICIGLEINGYLPAEF